MKKLRNFLSRKSKQVNAFRGIERDLSKVANDGMKTILRGCEKIGKHIEKLLREEGFNVSFIKSGLYYSETNDSMVVELVFGIKNLSKEERKILKNGYDGEIEVNGDEFEIYVPVGDVLLRSY